MENIDWQHLLFRFDGRINRGKFWLGYLAIVVIQTIIITIATIVNSLVFWLLLIALGFGVIWMSIALSVKRWHDRGKSGWWMFIALVPLVGGLWAFIETGFLEGTPGDNEYGPNPLA